MFSSISRDCRDGLQVPNEGDLVEFQITQGTTGCKPQSVKKTVTAAQ